MFSDSRASHDFKRSSVYMFLSPVVYGARAVIFIDAIEILRVCVAEVLQQSQPDFSPRRAG